MGKPSRDKGLRRERAIVDALHTLGYAKAADVRQGKYFVLDLDVATKAEAEKLAAEIADKVLANPVIEKFTVDVDGAAQ